jgi:hypothetical protein
MDPLTFDISQGNAVLKLTSTGAVVSTAVSFSPDYKTVTLTPSVNLTSATSYTIYVYGYSGDITDVAGNSLNAVINQSFTAE